MWPPAGVILAILGLVSARISSDDPSPSETNIKGHEASFSSNLERRENPNLFTDSEWSNQEPYTAPISDWDGANTDSLFPGTESNLPISDDWTYQLGASATTSGCNTPINSRLRLKRFDAQCPSETQEEKPICETALFSIAVCCLGPAVAEYVVVSRCALYDAFLYYCRIPKSVFCCRELEGSIGVICIKAFPGSEDDDEPSLFPESLDSPYPGEFPIYHPPPEKKS